MKQLKIQDAGAPKRRRVGSAAEMKDAHIPKEERKRLQAYVPATTHRSVAVLREAWSRLDGVKWSESEVVERLIESALEASLAALEPKKK